MLHKTITCKPGEECEKEMLQPIFAGRGRISTVPKYRIPENEMQPRDAYEVVHDELMLDGNARLNLATFVSTWMEPEATKLMTETFDKNMIDKDEYPQTAEIEKRCVNIIADLFNSTLEGDECGCSTIGSSEAAMLCGMAMKWRWRKWREARGLSTEKPNMIMSSGVQVCWEKFCTYWDIEERFVDMEEGEYVMNPEKAVALCDENTIGIVGILGTTFTGQFEDIKAINDLLEEYNSKDPEAWDVPLHVDAASGGFIAPFLDPDLEWDFRLKWVKSINVSGHKYGLVYPGVGWAVWRNWNELPEELIFWVDYLGSKMATFALNFSRPGNQVVAQYYNLVRLGREGYTRIQAQSRAIAMYLGENIEKMGPFELLSNGSELPVVAFKLKEEKNFSVYDFADRLRMRGWLIPAYKMAPNLEHVFICRLVIREGFSFDLANLLLEDMEKALKFFAEHPDLKPGYPSDDEEEKAPVAAANRRSGDADPKAAAPRKRKTSRIC